MKKVNFIKDVLPHLAAVTIFLLVTVVFFRPVFFGNKSISQHDIQQWEGGAKELMDHREATGEEGLWTNAMFSGMPAYFVNLEWSDQPIQWLQKVISLGLPHPVRIIFIAFLSYYILLISFGVRPWIAIGGALAFGISSFMIIGLGAGHNARIGAMAFMPLVLAGVHLIYKKNLLLGLGLTAAALALHLRVNHLQVTYYLLLILIIYGLVQAYQSIIKKEAASFIKKTGVVLLAALLGLSSFTGKFWSSYEYGKYSTRGPSELATKTTGTQGLAKDYAFQYSNGIWEPFTLLIPNVFGGASENILAADQDSKTFRALRSADPQTANQAARYTSSYWGNQPLSAPYYAGAIIIFLFVLGLMLAPRPYVIWLSIVAALGIVLSWGDSFQAFNYLMFDYFPGYNKFRSVTFALTLPLVAMPLLGMLGLEKFLQNSSDKKLLKKFYIAVGVTGGLCLLMVLIAGMLRMAKEGESELPAWLLNAMRDDRRSLMRADAFRSLIFILLGGGVIWLGIKNILNPVTMALGLSLIILVDLWGVSSRYFGDQKYQRKTDRSFFMASEADRTIQELEAYPHYRVLNLMNPWNEARTSYHHQSIGGYHGAKLKRYQEFYDHCLQGNIQNLIAALQEGGRPDERFGPLHMLNAKYIKYGNQKENIIENGAAYGDAWLANEVISVNNADEELEAVCAHDLSQKAVVNTTQFTLSQTEYAESGEVELVSYQPGNLQYKASVSGQSLVIFSEIYYPEGWEVKVNGKGATMIQANYVLRGLELPEGDHEITFEFRPKSYVVGNKITQAGAWVVVIVLIGGLWIGGRRGLTQAKD